MSFARPSGRLGNQFFQLHFLRQVARRFDFSISQYGFSDLSMVKDSGFKLQFGAALLKRPIRIIQEHVDEVGFEEFESQLLKHSQEGRHIVLGPGFLGKYLLETQYYPRSEILELQKVKSIISEELRVAIHFRAGDFISWDEKAIMPLKYYEKAIEYIVDSYREVKLSFNLFTDEATHDVARGLQERYKTLISIQSSNPVRDFLAMSESEIIVHSPSTFSFWASMIGQEKFNIYSAQWLDYKCESEDKFWMDLRFKGFEGMKIQHEIRA